MEEPGYVDPKVLNKFLVWQAFASMILWTLCVGAASAPETSSRISVVLAAGATIYMVLALGSLYWTGYAQTQRRKSQEEALKDMLSPQGSLSFGTMLFLVNFSYSFFLESETLGRALFKGTMFGVFVAGGLYVMYGILQRRK